MITFWNAFMQTVNDYRHIEDELVERRRYASNCERADMTLMNYEIIAEFPLQFVSRLYGGNFWGCECINNP